MYFKSSLEVDIPHCILNATTKILSLICYSIMCLLQNLPCFCTDPNVQHLQYIFIRSRNLLDLPVHCWIFGVKSHAVSVLPNFLLWSFVGVMAVGSLPIQFPPLLACMRMHVYLNKKMYDQIWSSIWLSNDEKVELGDILKEAHCPEGETILKNLNSLW